MTAQQQLAELNAGLAEHFNSSSHWAATFLRDHGQDIAELIAACQQEYRAESAVLLYQKTEAENYSAAQHEALDAALEAAMIRRTAALRKLTQDA